MSTRHPKLNIETYPDVDALATAVANWITELALSGSPSFSVSLAGGSTPRRTYEVLATPPLVGRFPWHKVHWFFGDERFVPHEDPNSNYRMALETMLTHAPVPRANIHPVPFIGLNPAQAGAAYERVLQNFYGAHKLDPRRPLFDLVLLGLGDDGHTASLFPGTAALFERQRWVVEVIGVRAEPRITLTIPTLKSSTNIAFLVSGPGKRPILQRVLLEEDFPATTIGHAPQTRWFIDVAAKPLNV